MPKALLTVTIKDCRVDTFRSGGKGGQHQNKRDTGVRVVHDPSGAVGECRETKSQLQNKRIAFTRMAETTAFTMWVKRVAAELQGQETVDQRVDRMMSPENLLIEGYGPEGWETL